MNMIVWLMCSMEIIRKGFTTPSDRHVLKRKVGKDSVTDDCTICLSSLGTEACYYELDCSHNFHVSCLDQWIDRCNEVHDNDTEMTVEEEQNESDTYAIVTFTCPLCRRQFVLP